LGANHYSLKTAKLEHYRYHFKSVDTEFGPVKEELIGDDSVIPGWEGRIVGWVEELSSSLDHVEI